MLCTIGNLTHLFRGYIIDFQNVTILNKSDFLPVRRVLGIAALDALIGEQRFLVNQGGVGKVEVFLACNAGLVEVPVAIALGGLDQGAAIL